MAVNQQRRVALKRLRADMEELSRSPVAGISAAPLENDMFEWHCNILLADVPQHLILFFPEEYPYRPPSAELAGDFRYGGGAAQPGKKGTQICMPMFSDYVSYHREWEKETGLGWSPGYTVQTCLINALSFLAEITRGASAVEHNVKNAEGYNCPDCGHSFKTPYPRMRREASIRAMYVMSNAKNSNQTHATTSNMPISPGSSASKMMHDIPVTRLSKTLSELPHVASKPTLRKLRTDIVGLPHATPNKTVGGTANEQTTKPDNDLCEKFQIVDYISKEMFNPQVRPISKREIFGYGLEIKRDCPQKVSSPYEFLSAGSFFSMKESSGYVQSTRKQELTHFLPMYLCSNHASGIAELFEESIKEISTSILPNGSPGISLNEQILNVLPMLMWNRLLEINDSCIRGCFSIHCLLLWAVGTCPGLQDLVDERLQAFIEKPESRLMNACSDIGHLLMLLTVSTKYRWHDIAHAYLSEFWRRETTDFVIRDGKLGHLTMRKRRRLDRTVVESRSNRKQLVCQVYFMEAAMPRGMSRDDVIGRYDANLGFPTDVMVAELKRNFEKTSGPDFAYDKWLNLLDLEMPSEEELFQTLKDAVHFCLDNDDYNVISEDKYHNGYQNGWPNASKLYKAALKAGKISRWGTSLNTFLVNNHYEATGSKIQDQIEASGSNNNAASGKMEDIGLESDRCLRKSERLLSKRKLLCNANGSNKKAKR